MVIVGLLRIYFDKKLVIRNTRRDNTGVLNPVLSNSQRFNFATATPLTKGRKYEFENLRFLKCSDFELQNKVFQTETKKTKMISDGIPRKQIIFLFLDSKTLLDNSLVIIGPLSSSYS